MKNAVKTYRRAVCSHLRCAPAQKRQLKQALSQMLHPLLEEQPAPDRNMLYESLGAPEAVAATLMKEVPTTAQTRWQTIHRGLIAVCVALIFAAFVYLVYEAAFKPVDITVYIYPPEIIERTED